MMRTIKKYLLLDYVYYATPFVFCVIYLLLQCDFTTLQYLINSVYSTFFNVVVTCFAIITIPNFCKLLYYHKQVKELPERIMLPATTSERFGGAGEGKTSSAILQAVFEAERMQSEVELYYYYMRANFNRWQKVAPWKLKNFNQIEKSVKFWQNYPEYIPYLASNIEISLPDGRKSMYVTREHVEQGKWLPSCFIVLDEAGTTLPQDEWQQRPADVVLFFRFIRHFGFKASLCEQKKDGILINVRSVLGGTVLCMGQRNALLPYLLIDTIAFLKSRLPKCKDGQKLGHFIEKFQDISSRIGFRIWEQLYFKTMEFTQYKPPKQITIVCTNKMPCDYDDTAFSDLYLAKDGEAEPTKIEGYYITQDSDMGKLLLRTHYEQEENRAKKELEEQVKQEKLQVQKLELEKKKQKLQDEYTK